MAIQRVTSFTATADINGLIREVGYDADEKRVWIGAMDADEAVELLRAMGKGAHAMAEGMPENEQVIIAAAAAPAASERAGCKDVPPAEPPLQVKSPRKATKAEPEKAEPEKKTAPAKKRGTSKPNIKDDVEDPVEAHAPPDELPASDPDQGALALDGESGEEASGDNGVPGGNGMSDDLKNARKLRDVVGAIYDEGHTTKAAIIARAREIQNDHPVLSRIKATLEERVEKAMGVLGITE